MPNTPNSISDWLLLQHAPKLGASSSHKLLLQFGSASKIRQASHTQLIGCGLQNITIEYLRQSSLPSAIEAELEWATNEKCHIISLDDPAYPGHLKTIHHAPILLYVYGDKTLLNDPQLAIVGSRNPTANGRDNAKSFAEHFSHAGLTITSGLALGIDGAAHAGALAADAPTIAVLATGVDRIYPASHKKLAADIIERGALVSEMPLGTNPLPQLFPQRNRIISGLSLGVLVVEAAQRSGSLITARLAAEQSREVFALPGSIHNPLARGCHQLIRQGAKLVESAHDVLEELAPQLLSILQKPALPNSTDKSLITNLENDNQRLLDALAYDPVSIDQLVERSGFSAKEVASMLLILELEGLVQTEAGGLYCRKSTV